MEMPRMMTSRFPKSAATRGTKGGELMRATDAVSVVSPSRCNRRENSICSSNEPTTIKKMYHKILRLPARFMVLTLHELAMEKQNTYTKYNPARKV